jgi:uncharacterized protein
MYLALHRGGWAMQKQLGQLLLDQLLVIYEIQQDDYAHLLTLMEKYRDRPMDLADATLVVAAEKTGYRQILTPVLVGNPPLVLAGMTVRCPSF